MDAGEPWMPTVRRMEEGEVTQSVVDLRHLDALRRPADGQQAA